MEPQDFLGNAIVALRAGWGWVTKDKVEENQEERASEEAWEGGNGKHELRPGPG